MEEMHLYKLPLKLCNERNTVCNCHYGFYFRNAV